MNIGDGDLWSGVVRLLGVSAALALSSCAVHSGGGDGRLWLKSTINGKPARLAFDTGAAYPALFGWLRKSLVYLSRTCRTLNPSPGVNRMMTGECKLRFGRAIFLTSFGVLDLPQGIKSDADGVVGWQLLKLEDNIIAVDALHETAAFLNSLPRKAAGWTKLRLVTNSNSGVLMMTVPRPGGTPCSILVDTGCRDGVALFPDQWEEWKTAHADQAVTLTSYYTFVDGYVVAEEGWAKTLAIGSLWLTNVPVTRAAKVDILDGSTNTVAMLGIAALKRFDLVIDGKKGFAYLHAKAGPPPPYEYNRLGAVFAPPDLESGNLVASVIAGSPAWEAGIRPGDVLTRVGNTDVRNWREDGNLLHSLRLLMQLRGTKLELTVMRGEEQIICHAVLREILSPEAK